MNTELDHDSDNIKKDPLSPKKCENNPIQTLADFKKYTDPQQNFQIIIKDEIATEERIREILEISHDLSNPVQFCFFLPKFERSLPKNMKEQITEEFEKKRKTLWKFIWRYKIQALFDEKQKIFDLTHRNSQPGGRIVAGERIKNGEILDEICKVFEKNFKKPENADYFVIDELILKQQHINDVGFEKIMQICFSENSSIKSVAFDYIPPEIIENILKKFENCETNNILRNLSFSNPSHNDPVSFSKVFSFFEQKREKMDYQSIVAEIQERVFIRGEREIILRSEFGDDIVEFLFEKSNILQDFNIHTVKLIGKPLSQKSAEKIVKFLKNCQNSIETLHFEIPQDVYSISILSKNLLEFAANESDLIVSPLLHCSVIFHPPSKLCSKLIDLGFERKRRKFLVNRYWLDLMDRQIATNIRLNLNGKKEIMKDESLHMSAEFHVKDPVGNERTLDAILEKLGDYLGIFDQIWMENQEINDDGLQKILNFFMTSHDSIYVIDLRNNKITDEGAKNILEFLHMEQPFPKPRFLVGNNAVCKDIQRKIENACDFIELSDDLCSIFEKQA